MTFRLRHLVAALVLHVLLFGLLAGGAQCSAKVVRPPPIQGVLLDSSRKETADRKKREDEARKAAEAEKKRREEEQRKQAEEQERARQQAEQQKKAADDKKAAEALKLKQAADAKKKKAEDQQKLKEAADKKKADEAAKKKKAQQDERERQESAQRELQDKARLEDEMRQEAMKRELEGEASERAASEKSKKQSAWADLLSRAIQRKWTRPSTVTQDFSCTVHVVMLPDGTVSAANIVKTCGNSSLDKSVEDAALRASPLPKPEDPSIFDRDLIINFSPGNQ